MVSSPSAASACNVGTANLLCNLPNELLIHIFELMPGEYDEQCRAFSAVARVCQQFHSLVTPLLYRRFEDCCAKHLQSFCYTVFARKDRASLVRHFKERQARNVDAPKRAGCNESWDTPRPDPALVMAARRSIPDHPLQIPKWRFIAYSLGCVCPNMQSLDITESGKYFLARLQAYLDKKVLTPSNSFQQVHTLSISIDPERSFDMHTISLLFNMPSLRVLTVKKASLKRLEEEVYAHNNVNELWLCETQTSTVEELVFEDCCLPIEWIVAAIMSCKALKHFHYAYYHWLSDVDVCPRLVGILANYKDSLQYLRINELHGCKAFSRKQHEPDELVSFIDYGSLTHIDIPLFILSTKSHSRRIQDIFPATLQVLTFDVRSAREGFSDAFFISLAEAAPNNLPSLESVEVICRIEQYDRDGYVPLHFCHLQRMFSRYDVDFVYFLEFVTCEFSAARVGSLLKRLRKSGPDLREIADNSSLETGCNVPDHPVPPDYLRRTSPSTLIWGYMQEWGGLSEFELMT